MALSGPQRYPGASTAYWYGSKYPGSAMESNVIIWHSTEGTSLPPYDGGATAPNFTARPNWSAKKLDWYQHFDFDRSARALVNASGGVETNTLNVCQVEIVGTCDPITHAKWTKSGTAHLYTPDLPDWAVRDLAAFAKWAHDQHGVPLTSSVTFKAYPGSYGSNGVRMSAAKWSGFTGHCGHQHVPENLHGDPGLLPIAAILARAKGNTTSTDQEDDMAVSDADAEKIAKKVLQIDGVISNPNSATAKTNPYISLATSARNIEIVARRSEIAVNALQATVDKLAGLLGKDVDTATVVAAVQAAIADAVVKVEISGQEV